MINRIVFSTTIVLLITTTLTTAQTIVGNWVATEIENSTIQVYESKDGFLYGKIIASDKKEWIGEIILKKVKYYPKEKVWKGEVYSLLRRFSIDATLSMETSKRLKLVGRKFFMTRTFYWHKNE